MIKYNYLTDFSLSNENAISKWISDTITSEDYKEDTISYVFCSDNYLLDINVKYLNHNTLTDIITFDYNVGKIISSDIFVSIDRVLENSKIFDVSFNDELHRVIIHGILHLCGYKDKTKEDKAIMRMKEDYYLSLRVDF
ncbi:rRNA maturation RNase YbeY [Aureibaculum marinum]|uniref:Endoribonuclease YbeY n=1 Tax=Aureibaculum marinum TaxID=2487930 RepID=A0A3N4NPQ3_9FLAO|nr:rRNA maturation RNase YbeY [Aureibaculum marinum]RPD96498.1 rRNA maturation RNase YbeY [Aureibaculum marinum]